MNAERSTPLQRIWQAARRRQWMCIVLQGLPVVLLLSALAWRGQGLRIAGLVLLLTSLALLGIAVWSKRKLDRAWLVRQLNARQPSLEDSADLFFSTEKELNPLQQLQRQRLYQRLRSNAPDLRRPWPKAGLAAAFLFTAVGLLLIWRWPSQPMSLAEAVATLPRMAGVADEPLHLLSQELGVQPPAYTGQKAHAGAQLDAKAPQGTRLQWRLRFSGMPKKVELYFHDGQRLALQAQGQIWSASRVLEKSSLYRIVTDLPLPTEDARLHRLDAIADQPPTVKAISPEQSLSLVAAGQRHWDVVFEGSDDYGLAGNAQLRITLVQGSGENIKFRESLINLSGNGSSTQRRYTRRLDFAQLGLVVGDDLIVLLSVRDNRSPQPQTARSASLILRWPADQGSESTGLDGMVKKVLPAYFRSQRQIIIDAESLIKQRRQLDAEHYLSRADEIGVDQRILRLRYGQFLGEEAEGADQPPPSQNADGEHQDHPEESAANSAAEPGHDHQEKPTTFGSQTDVLSEYGHTHDHAEAATLLDPETRATLKLALDHMWQSELQLRQGRPDLALPFAYKALGYIKQVQQAERIYLARVGPELPPIDESRRLGGDRSGFARPRDALATAPAADTSLTGLWKALAAQKSSNAEILSAQLDALQDWLRRNENRVADPLSVYAAIDAFRLQPDDAANRRELRARLWPLLPRPASQVPRRAQADAVGKQYLQALEQETQP